MSFSSVLGSKILPLFLILYRKLTMYRSSRLVLWPSLPHGNFFQLPVSSLLEWFREVVFPSAYSHRFHLLFFWLTHIPRRLPPEASPVQYHSSSCHAASLADCMRLMFCPFKRNHWTVIKTREGCGARGSTELAAPFLGNNHIQPIIECLDSATTRISDDKIKIL